MESRHLYSIGKIMGITIIGKNCKKSNMDSKKSNMDSKKGNMDSKNSNMGSKKRKMDSRKSNLDSKESNLDSKKRNMDSKKRNMDSKKSNHVQCTILAQWTIWSALRTTLRAALTTCNEHEQYHSHPQNTRPLPHSFHTSVS
jgi:hypothetical protein